MKPKTGVPSKRPTENEVQSNPVADHLKEVHATVQGIEFIVRHLLENPPDNPKVIAEIQRQLSKILDSFITIIPAELSKQWIKQMAKRAGALHGDILAISDLSKKLLQSGDFKEFDAHVSKGILSQDALRWCCSFIIVSKLFTGVVIAKKIEISPSHFSNFLSGERELGSGATQKLIVLMQSIAQQIKGT